MGNMDFEDIPIIEMRLRRMGKEIVSAFTAHAEELRPAIEDSVSRYLSSEHIVRVIDDQVSETIQKAIESAIDSYEVRQKLQTIVKEKLFNIRQEE